MALVSNPKSGDDVSVRQAIARLGSSKLGPTSTPTFLGVTTTSLTISGLTTDSLIYPVSGLLTSLGVASNGQIPIGSTGTTPVLATLSGTAKRVTVANTAGGITLSGPQDLDTVDSPTFANGTFTGSVSAVDYNEMVLTRTYDVRCIGDSLTSQGTYVARLLSLLAANWVVTNKGTSGNTTTQMEARFTEDVVNDTAGHCVIWGGINDVVNDVSAATIQTNLQTMYTEASDAGMVVVAINITPFKGSPIWTAGRQTVLDAVNTWIANTAIDIDYKVDAYTLLEDPETADTLLPAYSGDGLHLSTAGYNAVGDEVHTQGTWTNSTITISSDVNILLNQNLDTTASPSFDAITVDNAATLGSCVINGELQASRIGVGMNPANNTLIQVAGTITNIGTFITAFMLEPTLTASANSVAMRYIAQTGTLATGGYTGLSAAGLHISNPAVSGGGTIDNHYGIRILNQTRGTANYGIHAANTNNYFGGITVADGGHIGSVTTPDVITIVGNGDIRITKAGEGGNMLDLQSNQGTTGFLSAIRWGHVDDPTAVHKAGIFFERTGSWNRGKLHIALNATPDASDVGIADDVMVLDYSGVVDINGKITAGSFASPIDVTNTRQYGFELHYSGNNYDVTGIRSRAQLVTTDASTRTALGGLFQAANNDNINAGVLMGFMAEAIGKSTANASTISTMRGGLIGTEWGALDTVTSLKTLHLRGHSRNAAGAGSFGTGYALYIENEAVGGNGQAYDAGIYFKGTNLSAGNKAFTYGIDFTGGDYGTAEMLIGNAKVSSSSNDLIIQPATNSTTFFQVKDQAGNAGIVYDTTNRMLGLGVNPTRVLDITVTNDGFNSLQLLNANMGTSVISSLMAHDGGTICSLTKNGRGYTGTDGANVASAGILKDSGTAGLYIVATGAGAPIGFHVGGSGLTNQRALMTTTALTFKNGLGLIQSSTVAIGLDMSSGTFSTAAIAMPDNGTIASANGPTLTFYDASFLKIEHRLQIGAGYGGPGDTPTCPFVVWHVTKDALADVAKQENYHMQLYGNYVNGSGTGLCFGRQDVIGASIIAKDVGSWGISDLQFYTKTTATEAAPPTLKLAITSAGNIGMGGEDAPETLLELTHATPYITLHNSTHEDTDGGGESKIISKREDGAGTESVAGQIEISHDGAIANDQLGRIVEYVNTGAGLVEVRRADSAGNFVMANDRLIAFDTNAGLTASVTQSQGQGALTAQINEISTVANKGDTVTLPSAVTGVEIEIINNGANTLQIFPASGDNLGLGVNTAEELEANERVKFVAYNTTNWAKESTTEIIHAEIHDEDNTDAFVINDAGGDFHSYHTNSLAAGDLADWAFDAGGAGTSFPIASIADGADSGVDIAVTTTGFHGLEVGDIISQTNLTNAAYVGVFEVKAIISTTIYEVAAVYTATGTGTMDQAATLEADAVAAGVYSFAYYISATIVGNNETFDFQLYNEATAVIGSKIRRKFGAANDFGSMSGGGVVAVGDGEKISFALSNEDSAANIIIRNLTIVLIRL